MPADVSKRGIIKIGTLSSRSKRVIDIIAHFDLNQAMSSASSCFFGYHKIKLFYKRGKLTDVNYFCTKIIVADHYGLLGDKTGCVRVLKNAVEGGFFNYPFMLRDPFLDPVRDFSEFQRVLTQAKEKHEAFKKKFLTE